MPGLLDLPEEVVHLICEHLLNVFGLARYSHYLFEWTHLFSLGSLGALDTLLEFEHSHDARSRVARQFGALCRFKEQHTYLDHTPLSYLVSRMSHPYRDVAVAWRANTKRFKTITHGDYASSSSSSSSSLSFSSFF